MLETATFSSRLKKLTTQSVATWIAATVLAACTLAPDPIPDDVRMKRAQHTLAALYRDQEAVTRPLTLYEAIARAIKYNLDGRVKALESNLEVGEAALARLNLLPELTLSTGIDSRNNDAGSSSQSLEGNTQSESFSKSSGRTSSTGQLGVTWHLLDFGVSYVRAQQQADRVLIAEERRRGALQSIVSDVHSAYWKLVAAHKVVKESGWLIDASRKALSRARRVHAAALVPPLESLDYQRKLLETIQAFGNLQRNFSSAELELAALVNFPTGQRIEIALPDPHEQVVPRVHLTIEALEQQALIRRPEIRQEDLEYRIQKR